MDFRQLIKVLAEVFRVRIEMKQIGRPSGSRAYRRNRSVRTSALLFFVDEQFRIGGHQCCAFSRYFIESSKIGRAVCKAQMRLNFEVDAYVEGQKRLPSREIPLETQDGTFFHFKTDIFKRQITYSSSKEVAANLVTIDARRAFEVIALNKRGVKPIRWP